LAEHYLCSTAWNTDYGADPDHHKLSLDYAPAGSPYGSQRAFSFNHDGNYEICVMNTDGTGQISLTANSTFDKVFPTWPPHCSQISYATNQDCNEKIYVINREGLEQTPLTNHSASDRYPAWGIMATTTKIGVTNGQQGYLDWNRNSAWDSADKAYSFKVLGWTPVVGKWSEKNTYPFFF